jgi:hypothetical protein
MNDSGRAENWWPDEEYVPYIHAEQRLYAWILTAVAGIEPDEAMRRAKARFHYEPMNERGMITHAGAWRVAMGDLFGCDRRPDEFGLAEELEARVQRYFHDERGIA